VSTLAKVTWPSLNSLSSPGVRLSIGAPAADPGRTPGSRAWVVCGFAFPHKENNNRTTQPLRGGRRGCDSATRQRGEWATRRRGDTVTRRRGDTATRRLGDTASVGRGAWAWAGEIALPVVFTNASFPREGMDKRK